jgi:hypothetical protein
VDWAEGVKCKQRYVLRDVGLISLFVKGQNENNLDGRTNLRSHRNIICTDYLYRYFKKNPVSFDSSSENRHDMTQQSVGLNC